MALSNKTIIYGQWKKISTAGQDGVASVNKYLGNVLPSVLIAHTDGTQTPDLDDFLWAAAVNLDIDASYLLPENRISDGLYADNGSDIYYATVLQPEESVQLVVDFG